MRITVAAYAKSIGKTRSTIYEWIKDRQAGRESKLPSNVKVEVIAGHTVINMRTPKSKVSEG